MSDMEYTPHEPEQDSFSAPDQALPPAAQIPDDSLELFQAWSQLEIAPPARIPHLGHLCLLAAFALVGFVCATLAMMAAVHFHLFGATSMTKAATDVHYILGSETIIYLITLTGCLLLFPLLWNKSFFAGIQWHGAAALDWRLPATAVGCFVLAALDEAFLPGPNHAPIEDVFRSPGAAWLMFAFGVTFAPFFEEIAFRGFLLPSLATAWDWAIEKSTGKPAPPLDANGQPSFRSDARRSARPFSGPISPAGHGQPDPVRGAPGYTVIGCQHAGSCLLQLHDLLPDARQHRWISAFG
jgi:membrane protease YdiL (CAAX protease family)